MAQSSSKASLTRPQHTVIPAKAGTQIEKRRCLSSGTTLRWQDGFWGTALKLKLAPTRPSA